MLKNQQDETSVWWQGTLKAAAKGLAVGAAVGIASALVLHFAILPLLATAGFSFLTATFAGFLTTGGTFTIMPLAVFSGVSGMIGGAFSGGKAAVEGAKQEADTMSHDPIIAESSRRNTKAQKTTISAPIPDISDIPQTTSIASAPSFTERLSSEPPLKRAAGM